MPLVQRSFLKVDSYPLPLDTKHDAADVVQICPFYAPAPPYILHEAMTKIITTNLSLRKLTTLGSRCKNTP